MRQSDEILISLLVMAWLVEARDPYTGGHLWRVSRFSRLLAEDAALDEFHVASVSLGGFLHDLGKIGVPDAVLRKPGPLIDEEMSVIRTHPDIGFHVLAAHPFSYLVRHAVQSHHERPEGKGYPHGISGDMIPMDARIVGICDAFDAMTSSRPYRRGMAVEEALRIIEESLGKQFDARLGAHFVKMGRKGLLHHVVGHSDEGIPLRQCPICGPTLVLRRRQEPGSNVYCRNCAGEFVIAEDATGTLHAVPTGRMGTARDLEPEADISLIAQLVRESTSVIRGHEAAQAIPA